MLKWSKMFSKTEQIMAKKSTSNLESELKRSKSLEDFLTKNHDELAKDSLSEQIQRLLDSKGLIKSEVVKKCNLNDVYAYQIISGARRPSRDKLLCLCIAIGATLDETKELLLRGGFAPLYVRNQRDSIIIFAISHNETILQLNDKLFEHGEELLD